MLARITPYNGTKSTVASTNVSEGTRKMAQSPRMRAMGEELRKLVIRRQSLELELSQSRAAYKRDLKKMFATIGDKEAGRAQAVYLKSQQEERNEPVKLELREVIASIEELKFQMTGQATTERENIHEALARIESKLDLLINSSSAK